MHISDKRIIGTYDKGTKGPTVIIIGGLHGNEPAGALALERVFAALDKLDPEFYGRFIGLRGNLSALAAGKRYIDHDLNRLWSKEAIEEVRQKPQEEMITEEKEMLELLTIIESEFDGKERCVLIDLHTTSAPGGFFSIVSDRTEDRLLASALHAPIIFGLTHSLAATTNVLMEERGYEGLAFEGGQHDDPAAVDNHEAAIWLMLEYLRCVDGEVIEHLENYHYRLISSARQLPHYTQVIYRHPIEPVESFHMHPGFINFHKVYKDEPIARDRNGDICAPVTGLMLMPLYQPQGEDGFFIVEEIESPPY